MYKELIEKNIKLCQINYCGEMCECEDKLKSYSKCLLISYLEEENIRLEGEKKELTKHEFCTLDDNWCYDHCEIMKDEEAPNGAYYFNQALQSQVEHNKEVISYLKEM